MSVKIRHSFSQEVLMPNVLLPLFHIHLVGRLPKVDASYEFKYVLIPSNDTGRDDALQGKAQA
jgi:hypothetical protein